MEQLNGSSSVCLFQMVCILSSSLSCIFSMYFWYENLLWYEVCWKSRVNLQVEKIDSHFHECKTGIVFWPPDSPTVSLLFSFFYFPVGFFKSLMGFPSNVVHFRGRICVIGLQCTCVWNNNNNNGDGDSLRKARRKCMESSRSTLETVFEYSVRVSKNRAKEKPTQRKSSIVKHSRTWRGNGFEGGESHGNPRVLHARSCRQTWEPGKKLCGYRTRMFIFIQGVWEAFKIVVYSIVLLDKT